MKISENSFHLTGLSLAIYDYCKGIISIDVWSNLAVQEIRQRYRRSSLGPFWHTLSMAIMVAALGLVYATIFRQELSSYLPYATIGLVLWSFQSSIVSDGCLVFVFSEGFIRQTRLPYTLYCARSVWKNFIIFAHNSIILVSLLIWYQTTSISWALIAVLYLPFYLLSGIAVTIILAILCTRFRDLSPIIQSILQVTFFVTPIMWNSTQLEKHSWILDFNPFFHFIEVMRSPLLGYGFAIKSTFVIVVWTAIMTVLAIMLLRRYKLRIPYWL